MGQANSPHEPRGASYDSMSRWYDLLSGPYERRYREAGLQALAPQAGESLLEVGFGTGHGLVALGRAAGPSGRACGVDLSQGMCRVAARRVAEAGLAARVTVLRGDALHLPVTTGAIDAAFMSFTLELFPAGDIPGVLAECRRVLHAGGRLAVVSMALPESPNPMTRLYDWFHRHWPQYVDCRPIAVRDYLTDAGFAVESAQRFSMAGLPVEALVARR